MYDFKLVPEAVRAGAFALIVFAVTLGVGFDLEAILADWKPWATGAISGGVAAACAAVLAVLTRKR